VRLSCVYAWRVSDDHERCLVRFLVLLWFAHPIMYV
jgi:hypothetical protein